jgi:hypothetical protein
MEFIFFVKKISWLIGFCGGILGIISFRFNYKNYIEKFEKEKNREIFLRHINISYQECFAVNLRYPSERYNIQRVLDLIFVINQNEIGFKGYLMKFRYFRLRRICSTLLKDSSINVNFAGFGIPQATLDKFYTNNTSNINKLQKQYLTFYEFIVDYSIAK